MPPIDLNNIPPEQLKQISGLKKLPDVSGKLPFKRSYYKSLRKGSLISCEYSLWKHDPRPLILVTDVYANRIRGVNLHYLTFNYMKSLLKYYCGKDFMSYSFIKHDAYIINAFRTYKKSGLRKIQALDCDVILSQIGIRRSFNPQEIGEIRRQIKELLQQQMNPTAEQLSQQYTQIIGRDQSFRNNGNEIQDGRRSFRPSATIPAPSATMPTSPASIPINGQGS